MKKRRAFTYVELTIVLAIIAILAAIAIPNFLEAGTRALVSRSKAELAELKMAIEAYRLDHRSYPLNLRPGRSDPRDQVCLTTPIAYLPRVMLDVMTRPEYLSHHAITRENVPYHYFNALQVNATYEGGLRLDSLGETLWPGQKIGMIWGVGPEARLDAEGDSIFTRTRVDGGAWFVPYNPTNGTLSTGDIQIPLS